MDNSKLPVNKFSLPEDKPFIIDKPPVDNYCNNCSKKIDPGYEICLSCYAKMMDEQAGE